MAWLGWIGAVGYGQEPAQPKPVEWLELFNGKDLTGWVAEGKVEFKDKDTGQALPNWSVRDGLIRCEGHGFGFLRYAKQKFTDFELQLEYRMLPRGKSMGNSGIGIRVVPYDPKRDEQTRPSLTAYEVQLLDDAGRKPSKYCSGALYRYVAPQAHRRQACAGVEPGDDPLCGTAHHHCLQRYGSVERRSIHHRRDPRQAARRLHLLAMSRYPD
jgi:hypothetical protein